MLYALYLNLDDNWSEEDLFTLMYDINECGDQSCFECQPLLVDATLNQTTVIRHPTGQFEDYNRALHTWQQMTERQMWCVPIIPPMPLVSDF